MSTISAAIPDIIRANAVVEPTNPAPTIAIRGTLGPSDGCVEIFCEGDSVSGSCMDLIFSSRRQPSFDLASCKFFFSTEAESFCNQGCGARSFAWSLRGTACEPDLFRDCRAHPTPVRDQTTILSLRLISMCVGLFLEPRPHAERVYADAKQVCWNKAKL